MKKSKNAECDNKIKTDIQNDNDVSEHDNKEENNLNFVQDEEIIMAMLKQNECS